MITLWKYAKLQNLLLILGLFVLFSGIGLPIAQGSNELSAEEILDKVDDLHRGDSSKGTMVMNIKTENWSRELKLEFWSLGQDHSLFRILSPPGEAGTATLRSENDIWNYLPKVNRTVKLPSSMMSESWMGSHITNNDLVRESRFADDYTFEITYRGKKDSKNVIEIECIPKEYAAVVWGKVEVQVEQGTYLPIQIRYYNEKMELTRTFKFSDVRDVGDRRIPVEMTVYPEDKPDEKTTVRYDDIEFDIEIDEGFFSMRTLRG